ncbi:hypothetical protein JHK86_005699 [Glycine max]|nr:hypothetical protein JHK86_005699 [Glycine max]
MAATLTSRCSLLGRSLLGGLRNNNLSGSLTSHEIKSSNFLSQQHHVHTDEDGSEGG